MLQIFGSEPVDDAVKLLETVSKSTDKSYSVKANYRLGMFYSSNKDSVKAKTYFLAATKDK